MWPGWWRQYRLGAAGRGASYLSLSKNLVVGLSVFVVHRIRQKAGHFHDIYPGNVKNILVKFETGTGYSGRPYSGIYSALNSEVNLKSAVKNFKI